ncbi:hypothetical protein [Amycolatopsis plumensis]|uniref:Uncharacterized protein n=1 Tax=Amycolatopsis plumensis TaxID=236508 RepID=A0ABV5TVH3_9PSEU
MPVLKWRWITVTAVAAVTRTLELQLTETTRDLEDVRMPQDGTR